MADHPPTEKYDDPSVELVFKSVARWMRNYREAFSTAGQLAKCDPDEVAKIARDLQIAPRDLVRLSGKGPGAAQLLLRMLEALGVDPKNLGVEKPAVMRDLQRLCITCGYKQTCERDLAKGMAAERYEDYCPNAYTLDALIEEARRDRSFWESEKKTQ